MKLFYKYSRKFKHNVLIFILNYYLLFGQFVKIQSLYNSKTKVYIELFMSFKLKNIILSAIDSYKEFTLLKDKI